MSARSRVVERTKQLRMEGSTLAPTELAALLAPEFPELAPSTLVRYCCRDGGARQPKPSRVTVIASDFHVPFHNVPAVENWLRFCQDQQPHRIVINGDFLDCISISSFPVPPGIPLLQDEIDEGYTLLKRLRESCQDSLIDFLQGNHEQRLERVLMREPGLYGLKALSIRALLELDQLRISHRKYMDPLQVGGLTVVHGNRVSKHAGYTAKATLLDGGFDNVVIGHTHRLGLYCHTGHKGKKRAAEIGGFFDIDQADYLSNPNWQNGFAIWRENADGHSLELVEVSPEGNFVAGGRHYSSSA